MGQVSVTSALKLCFTHIPGAIHYLSLCFFQTLYINASY